jgi:hypothetical protein
MNESGGALSWLDSLTSSVVNLSGAVGTIKANLKGPSTSDETEAARVARIQSAATSLPVIWIIGGLCVLGVAVLALRK